MPGTPGRPGSSETGRSIFKCAQIMTYQIKFILKSHTCDGLKCRGCLWLRLNAHCFYLPLYIYFFLTVATYAGRLTIPGPPGPPGPPGRPGPQGIKGKLNITMKSVNAVSVLVSIFQIKYCIHLIILLLFICFYYYYFEGDTGAPGIPGSSRGRKSIILTNL